MSQIIRLENHSIEPNLVAAIGFFDGVHIAHQVLIQKALSIANTTQSKSAIITFDVHPKTVIFGLDYRYITPLPQKLRMLEVFKVDYIYVIEFNETIAKSSPQAFIDQYLKSLHTLVCGFDFKFGYRGQGTVTLLQEDASFDTVVVPEMRFEEAKIGSTHIRDLIEAGYVDAIPATLGRPYSIRGEVIHGSKKGRLIGYPTANIDTDSFMVPKTGVYITQTLYQGQWYASMTSVGYNPTLNQRQTVSVESYLIDFSKTIYGETIETVFLKRIRDEMKFDDVKALIKQIDADALETANYFKKHQIDLPFFNSML
jgi:riboflavin kinase/FMN adenylyltransferase